MQLRGADPTLGGLLGGTGDACRSLASRTPVVAVVVRRPRARCSAGCRAPTTCRCPAARPTHGDDLPGHRRVRRRARPRAAVVGQGQRGDRRVGREDRARPGGPPGSPCACPTTSSCPTTPSPSSSRPPCSGRSTSSSAPPAGTARGPPRRRRRHPARRARAATPRSKRSSARLSLLLNGGGVAQLKIIETELNDALRGNQSRSRTSSRSWTPSSAGSTGRRARSSGPSTTSTSSAAKLAAQKDDIAAGPRAAPAGPEDPRRPAQAADRRCSSAQSARRRRHQGDHRSPGRPGSQPEGARPDPGQPQQGRRRPAQVPPAAPHLPVPRLGRGAIKGDYTNLHITSTQPRTSPATSGSEPPATGLRAGCRLPTPCPCPRSGPRSRCRASPACRVRCADRTLGSVPAPVGQLAVRRRHALPHGGTR